MTNETSCLKCGSPLTLDERDGLCPKCWQARLMNAYSKLRPWTDIESCECAEVTGLMLFDCLTDNPIHCAVCKNEVDPERLGLTVEEVEAVASWHSVNRGLYALWLDSGEYADWAKARLLDWTGQVNQNGMKAAKTLSARLPTFVRLFRDCTDDDYEMPVDNCPVCGKALDQNVTMGWGQCPDCRISV